MRHLVQEAGLADEIELESAGTGSWHIGHAPDSRSAAAAAERGIKLDGEARQVTPADFEAFDLLIAMDRSNRDDLLALAPDDRARGRVRMLREFGDSEPADVPDPYYGEGDSFEVVLDIVERCCQALLDELRRS